MSATAVEASDTRAEASFQQALAGKYLTFALADEEYGLPVLRVREIIKVMDITAVPQMPSHVRGVVNLRGKVIPVVDLRLKFGFEPRADSDRTCIIVVDVASRAGSHMTGMIVDAVSEVLNIPPNEIEETPDFGTQVTTDYLKALAKVKGQVKMLLDLDCVLGAETLTSRRRVTSTPACSCDATDTARMETGVHPGPICDMARSPLRLTFAE